MTRDGKTKTVKLRDIAKLEETQTLPSVSRLDQRTYLSVSGSIDEAHNVTLVTQEAEEAFAKLDLPAGVTYEFTGENETIMDAMQDLLTMMGLGILLVYLIMVAQFQSAQIAVHRHVYDSAGVYGWTFGAADLWQGAFDYRDDWLDSPGRRHRQ